MPMISHASTSKDEINLTKVTVPGQLHAYNLHVNEHKTEEYTIPDATHIRGKDSWRKCKLLGFRFRFRFIYLVILQTQETSAKTKSGRCRGGHLEKSKVYSIHVCTDNSNY